MKKPIVLALAALLLLNFACQKKKEDGNLPKQPIPSASRSSDMVLIYHGGEQRPLWNTAEIKHYVFRPNATGLDWLFDTFLFLEIQAKINKKAYDFGSATSYTLKPTKAEWEWLIHKNFSAIYGPAAIEKVLDSLHNAGHSVPSKRKIFFGIPNPIVGTKWGALNKQELDFDNEADRLRAVQWYVDQTIEQFKNKNFKYLELAGFYWIPESAKYDLSIISSVTAYVHQTKHKICWIPYNYAPNAEQWKEVGFDIAYQQPNYFFDLDKSIYIMSRALTFARDHGMSMEMEFDAKIFKPGFIDRFYDYINLFDKYGVWDSPSVSYYEGGGAWMQMATANDPLVFKAYTDLADIIARRQQKLNLELGNNTE
ncbi:hypothetical protein BCY91_11025 [Pelobium manganitolerans]|uniref:DUF4855 domain-containing protein n=1 Tax=Pelobium manganitolerans TaxID=1842495 RepID=A0A419S245_9SPHI|nr:DUF4855 domain-containing protein [Pelobium manganitolerans]RKD12777.1 hypothetical protein BCY91_11025 [Pelobium manganitolerans]